jgi:prepilin-type N-terminal cleavage/methylation domain-containing protein
MPNKNKAGFTLMEILVAIAIVAILASVVLVSMAPMRAKARAAKAMAQLSSALPSMISCWGNGKIVKDPVDSGGAICQETGINGADIAGYGYYPDLSSGDLASYGYGRIDMTKGSWHFGAESSTDDKAICCNMTLNSCAEVTRPLGNSTCDDNVPTN